MNAVSHFVGSEGASNFLDELFPGRDFGKRERTSRTLQAIQVFVKLEDPTVVESQSFPDRVTALHRRIERADRSFVAMRQNSVDVHDQVAVAFVEFLKH